MAKEIKFTDEELKSLSDLTQGYQTTQISDNLEFKNTFVSTKDVLRKLKLN